jgi:flagellum-specific peptidoglycan hydrolase FlgJ
VDGLLAADEETVADNNFILSAAETCDATKANQEGQNVGTKSDSSIFSQSRSQFPSFLPAKQSPIASQSMTESQGNFITKFTMNLKIIKSKKDILTKFLICKTLHRYL